MVARPAMPVVSANLFPHCACNDPFGLTVRKVPEVPGDRPDRPADLMKDRDGGEFIVFPIHGRESKERTERIVFRLAAEVSNSTERAEGREIRFDPAPGMPAFAVDEVV